MAVTRRDFVVGSVASVIGGVVVLQSSALKAALTRDKTTTTLVPSLATGGAGAGVIVCPSSQSRRTTMGMRGSPSESDLVVYDLDRDEHYSIIVPIGLGHSVAVNPQQPSVGVVVEIFGDYAAEFDVKNRTAIRQLRAGKGRVFSGHAVYSPDGRFLYTPEYVPRHPDQCALVKRDVASGESVQEFKTYGVRPHEAVWVNDEVLAVSHYGDYPKTKPSDLKATVSFINTTTGELLKSVTPEDKNLALCHLKMTDKGTLYILTLNALEREGEKWNPVREIRMNPEQLRAIGYKNGLTGTDQPSHIMTTGLNKSDSTLKIAEHKDGFAGSLSVVFHAESGTLAMTHVNERMLTFWDAEKQEIKKKVELVSYPTGLALTQDQKNYVTMDERGQIFFIDTQTYELKLRTTLGLAAASGSAHIYSMSSS